MSDKKFQQDKKTATDLKRVQVQQAASILVVCEGQTEGDYIRHLRKLWGIEEKIHLIDAEQHICIKTFEEIQKKPPDIGKAEYGSSPISVVNYAIAVAEKRKTPFKPYQHIYCLFDKDDPKKFAEACNPTKPIRGGKVIKITSVPCFEYWLLLHFEKVDAPLKSVDNTIARLKNTGLNDYSRDNKRIDKNRFTLLSADKGIENATKWSKELFETVKQLGTDDPTTKMFDLMNEIQPKPKK